MESSLHDQHKAASENDHNEHNLKLETTLQEPKEAPQ
jgi:hypothetical protein